MAKAFASQGDMTAKTISFVEISAGVYAFTAQGDPNTGVEVYQTSSYTGLGTWQVVGGTSLGKPAWAARTLPSRPRKNVVGNELRFTPCGILSLSSFGSPGMRTVKKTFAPAAAISLM